jgi:hypothetical protein
MIYFVKSLKALKLKDIDNLLSRDSQIKRTLQSMRNLNQLKNFYESISAIVTSSTSI